MYKRTATTIIAILFMITAVSANETDRVLIPLSDPGKACVVHVEVLKGDINVTGYKGSEIVVESRAMSSKPSKVVKKNNKAAGMKRINISSPGLEIEEQNNRVTIESGAFNSGLSLNIKVPLNSSLKLRSTMNGNITVNNIKGSIEAEKMQGSIYMTGISGNVVASANSGEIKVQFDKADFSKPMSFNSFTGDIDLTFPASVSCNVSANVKRGELYSDFDIKRSVRKAKKGVRKNGKFRISFNDFHGSINKGGQELILKTFTGNIYLRKKK